MTNAQHSAATPEHGTPAHIVEFARTVLGTIDVDPATSDEWNVLVRARRIFTKAKSGLKHPWFAGAPRPDELLTDLRDCHAPLLDAILSGRIAEAQVIAEEFGIDLDVDAPPFGTVFLNPPGNKDGSLVARFWTALAEYYRRGFVRSAIWVGFNIEQIARLQRVGACTHPLNHTTLIPSRRVAYRDTPTTHGEDPPHASFVTLLSDDIRQIETFTLLGSQWGHVIPCGGLRR